MSTTDRPEAPGPEIVEAVPGGLARSSWSAAPRTRWSPTIEDCYRVIREFLAQLEDSTL